MRTSKLKKLTIGDYVIPAILILLALMIIIPLWYVITVSLVPHSVFIQNRLLLFPQEITFESCINIFTFPSIQTGFTNTVFVTITSTIYSMALNVAFAYAMLKPIPGRRIIWAFLMFTMFFSGGILPWFLLMVNLGMMNNLWAMVLPHGTSILPLYLCRAIYVPFLRNMKNPHALMVRGS